MEHLGTNKSSPVEVSSSPISKTPDKGEKEAISDLAKQRIPNLDLDDTSRISTRRFRQFGNQNENSVNKVAVQNLGTSPKAESERTTRHSDTVIGFGGTLVTPAPIERIYVRTDAKASTPNPVRKDIFQTTKERSQSVEAHKEDKPEHILRDIKNEMRAISGDSHPATTFNNLKELEQRVNNCKSRKGELEKYLNKAFKILSKGVVKALGSKVAKCAKKGDLDSIETLNGYFAGDENYAKWAIKQVVKNKFEQVRIIDLVLISPEKMEQKGKQYEKIFDIKREINDFIRNKKESDTGGEDDLKYIKNVNNLFGLINSYLTENISIFVREDQRFHKEAVIDLQNELENNFTKLLNVDDLDKNLEIVFDYDKGRGVIAEKLPKS